MEMIEQSRPIKLNPTSRLFVGRKNERKKISRRLPYGKEFEPHLENLSRFFVLFTTSYFMNILADRIRIYLLFLVIQYQSLVVREGAGLVLVGAGAGAG